MGDISGSTISDNPMTTIANPGQLGVMGLDYFFSGALYPSSTTLFPASDIHEFSYSASAFNVGLKLNRFAQLPFGLGIGLGYSHINHDLGQFVKTGADGPDPIGTFSSEEHANNFSIGVGINYYVTIGIGYTTKSVESNLAPFNVQNLGKQGVAKTTTYDIGFVSRIPVMDVLGRISGSPIMLFDRAEPLLDIFFGSAHSNLGDKFVEYIDPEHADPLPRNAMIGISYKAGLWVQGSTARWEALSFTLAREADDILVHRFPPPPVDTLGVFHQPPSPVYVDGDGSIQFFNNVILGQGNNHLTLHKGWQINFGELFFLRGGSVRGRGSSYTTSGYGIQLSGIWKALDALSPRPSFSPALSFITSHFDARFDHASSDYDDPTNPNNGISYNGISLVIRQ